jgi:hypothetical protein
VSKKTKFKLCSTCHEPVPRAHGHFQDGIRSAAKKNLIAVEPAPNELQIDLDGVEAIRRFGKQYHILERAGLTKGWRKRVTNSGTKGHVHVTITMPYRPYKSFRNMDKFGYSFIDKMFCVAFQAVLGSDIQREAFNLSRVLNGQKYPIVFFEKEPRHDDE